MKFNYLKLVLFSISILLTITAQAGPIITTTYGTLTSNSDQNFMTDISTGRIYSKFDAISHGNYDGNPSLFYANILALTQTGAEYEGWSLLDFTANVGLISAITNSDASLCDFSSLTSDVWVPDSSCGSLPGYVRGGYGVLGGWSDFDSWMFDLDDGGIGLTYLPDHWSNDGGDGDSVKTFRLTDRAEADYYSTDGFTSYILYRDAAPDDDNDGVEKIPEPSTLLLFLTGLIGLVLRRNKLLS